MIPKAVIKRILDEIENPYEGIMYEHGQPRKPRNDSWCRIRRKDIILLMKILREKK